MTIEFTPAPVAMLLALVALTALAAFARLGRPWDLDGLSPRDRFRIAVAVNRYDTWLSLRSVSRRRRRDLREELRTNLWAAARRVGAREALAAVGSLRDLAREATPARTGPRWLTGVGVALVTVELVVIAQFLVMSAWLDAAQASKVAEVASGIGLFPGMQARYTSAPGADGLSVAMSPGPSPLVLGALAFLIASRPWRLARRTG
ncbi:MAG: hypothetical protein WAL50_01190 [Kineosporiaceae bacterium]